MWLHFKIASFFRILYHYVNCCCGYDYNFFYLIVLIAVIVVILIKCISMHIIYSCNQVQIFHLSSAYKSKLPIQKNVCLFSTRKLATKHKNILLLNVAFLYVLGYFFMVWRKKNVQPFSGYKSAVCK